MKLTREEALNRVIDTYVSAPEGDKISSIADLLLSAQAETEQNVERRTNQMWLNAIRHAVESPGQVDLIGDPARENDVRSAIMSLRSETERRVVEKCCEIAEAERNDWTTQKSSSVACISAASIRNKIRAAFPEEVPQCPASSTAK